MADPLAAGDAAPAFTAPRDGGGAVSLADHAGRIVVLYFYPRDDTPGCTLQARDFTALAAEFAAAGAVVIGVSGDSVRKHERFRDKHALGIALLSDADTAIAGEYGVWKEKSLYGKTHMGIERSTFVIDGTGTIRYVQRKVRAAGHAAQVLEVVRGLSRDATRPQGVLI